jgi:hypothetical protein
MGDHSDVMPPNERPVPPRRAVLLAMRLRALLLKAANALVPPQVQLMEMATGAAFTAVIGEVARRRLTDALARRPLSAAELAEEAKCSVGSLQRTLRACVAIGLVTVDAEGRYHNTKVGSALVAGEDSARDFVLYFASEANLRAWENFRAALDTGRSAFESLHRRTVWDWFSERPDEGETFAGAMASITRLEAPAIAKAYPFGEIERVCDVGGGSGTLLGHLLHAWPQLRGLLFEAQHVLAAARRRFERWGVSDRAGLVPGSFFDEVPPGCDAYLLKNILHDWDDERCVRILGHVRRAALPGHRVLVCEGLTDGPLPHALAFSDLQMMVVCSGRERGRQEYAELLSRSGFRLSRASPTSSPMTWVIEGIAV